MFNPGRIRMRQIKDVVAHRADVLWATISIKPLVELSRIQVRLNNVAIFFVEDNRGDRCDHPPNSSLKGNADRTIDIDASTSPGIHH